MSSRTSAVLITLVGIVAWYVVQALVISYGYGWWCGRIVGGLVGFVPVLVLDRWRRRRML